MDNCTATNVGDDTYFFYDSSYCNATSLPEPLPGWYSVISYRTSICTTETDTTQKFRVESKRIQLSGIKYIAQNYNMVTFK